MSVMDETIEFLRTRATVKPAAGTRTVIVTSADKGLRQRLREVLGGMRWQVREAAGGAETMAHLEQEGAEALLLDS
jgi:DNA-binding NtrC family response regulator